MNEINLSAGEIFDLKEDDYSQQIVLGTVSFSITKESEIVLPNMDKLKLEKVNGRYKPIDFDWYLSPEEITNKNIMEPKFGGAWIDNKFIENKEYKYFITEFAALVDSL